MLKVGGTLTVVIQKKQGAPSAEKKMAEVFGNVEIVTKDKGYYILRSVLKQSKRTSTLVEVLFSGGSF